MNRVGRVLAPLVLGLLLLPLIVGQASSPIPARELIVGVSPNKVSAVTGESFSITSKISNLGTSETPPLTASLNFASLDESAYIDLEGWSPDRTMQVAAIPPGSEVTLTWRVNPVLEGNVAAYVVVMPASFELAVMTEAVSSSAVHLDIAARRNLNPGGVLPVVLAVPGALVAVAFGMQMLRRSARG